MSKFILFKEHKKQDGSILLEIQLNNPDKLNALNFEMISVLNQEIKKWNQREDLSLIFIHATPGRAFCAGGDVSQLYHKIIESKNKGKDSSIFAKEFFHTEYETDFILSQFNKPIVLWGDGIVMGGGMGLFMAASHAIATENSLFAMPEISIGFFPDVGASYFLNQIPNNLGRYIALTACQLNAKSAQYLNLTSCFFESKDKQKVFDFVKQSSFKDKYDFDFQFKSFSRIPSFLSQQACWIQEFKKHIFTCLEFKDIHSFYDYLSQLELPDKQWEQNRQNFIKASPSSLAIIFEQLKRAKKETDLKKLFEMEAVIASNICCENDFIEGVRALLIDKTKDPQWKPSSIGKLNMEQIQQYFVPPNNWNYIL